MDFGSNWIQIYENGRKRGIFTKVCTFHVTFEFGAPVLEPGDDLGVGQTQRQGDLVPIGR